MGKQEKDVGKKVQGREALEGRMEGKWVCPCSPLSPEEQSHLQTVQFIVYAAILSDNFWELS